MVMIAIRNKAKSTTEKTIIFYNFFLRYKDKIIKTRVDANKE